MTTISENFALLGPCFAADTETALIPDAFRGRDYVRLFQAHSDKHEFCYDLKDFTNDQWAELKQCLENPNIKTIWHNAEFDLRVLAACDIHITQNYNCTMTMSVLLNNGKLQNGKIMKHNLADVAKRTVGIELDKTLQAQNWMIAELNEASLEYGMNDVRATWAVFKHQHPQMLENKLETPYEIEMLAVLPNIQMMHTGLYVDRTLIDEMREAYDVEKQGNLATFIEILESELPEDYKLPRHEPSAENAELPHLHGKMNLETKESGYIRKGTKIRKGFNPDSSAQVLDRFRHLTPSIEPCDPTGKPSLEQKYLAPWKHLPIVQHYLAWKTAHKASQICLTLIKHISDDDRIHARFNPLGTGTGRYSSSNPNLQNVPRGEMRTCFPAPDGKLLVDIDFSGMELRAACSPRIANEPAMIQAFADGADIHRRTASLMFDISEEEVSKEQRRQAKAVNFAALFGGSGQGIVNYFSGLGLTISLKQGEEFLKTWLDVFPNIRAWHERCKLDVENEVPVYTVDGRRRFLEGGMAKYTTMCNNIVQGSCASAMKLALRMIWDRMPEIDTEARLVAVIHDEVLIEASEDKAHEIFDLAQNSMTEAGVEIFGDEVLLVAEGGVANSWGDAK